MIRSTVFSCHSDPLLKTCRGPNSLAHLQALDLLLQPSVAQRYAAAEGANSVQRILGYLVRRGLYSQLSRAIRGLVRYILKSFGLLNASIAGHPEEPPSLGWHHRYNPSPFRCVLARVL